MEVQSIINDFNPLIQKSSGKLLKQTMGLQDFKYVWIRRAMNSPIPLYIIYYNSRYPNLYLPISQLKKLKAFSVKRIKKLYSQETMDYKMSVPVALEDYKGRIIGGSMLIKYDLAGELFRKEAK